MYRNSCPTYFGWFLNDSEQSHLKKFSYNLLCKTLELAEVKGAFNNNYSHNLALNWKFIDTRLHVTSKYCGRKNTSENQNYTQKAMKSLNTINSMTVFGFLLTDKTFSGSVKLDKHNEKLLQNSEDGCLETEIAHISVACSMNNKPVQCKYDHMNATKIRLAGVKPRVMGITEFGTVKKLSKSCFFIELSDPLEYKATFSIQ